MRDVRRCGWRGLRPARAVGAVALAVAIAAAALVGLDTGRGSADEPCAPGQNAIACENAKPGSPPSVWDAGGDGDASIQGFATQMSVNLGATVDFKINTDASAYTVDIFRTGYYQGDGARLVASVTPSATLPQSQPSCLTDATTGLVDCGNWSTSASWTVPNDAVSGVYVATLRRTDTGGVSNITFVVRDDSSHADLLFQTSDATWQAYNTYGGNSLYLGTAPAGRAYKVSYNRPLLGRLNAANENNYFSAEYPMVRFLERNGYDVSYFSNVDTDTHGSLIGNHKVFLSNGHDEYWSGAMRANVQTARDEGVNLAFFSGNSMFWKTRYEASIDGSGDGERTLVSYKETHANGGEGVAPSEIDPTGDWTGTWRDPRFASPPDGGWPENQLMGGLSTVNGIRDDAITIGSAYRSLRLWRNTAIASLATGASYAMPIGTLGYEWGGDVDNDFRPSGLVDLSSTYVAETLYGAPGGGDGNGGGVFTQYGHTVAAGPSTNNLTLYRAASGALVFSTQSVQWSWGLDAVHDAAGTPVDTNLQQATVNLLADMSAQPTTLTGGLSVTATSSDTTAPSAVVTSPAPDTQSITGQPVTVSGNASDAGGGVVAGVNVSIDDGATWHAATATGSDGSWTAWSYTWTPTGTGVVTIRVQAVDDSGNVQSPFATVSIDVAYQCPCSVWSVGAAPVNAAAGDSGAVEVGVKFRSDVAGVATGVRFFKGAGNSGTHVGNLWSSTGSLLASATFSGESASGWQQVDFASPVAIAAGTTYVASYFAPNGHYASDNGAFATAGVDNAPLHALRSGVDGGNGVYHYGAGGGFPTDSYQATNYWVDVVMNGSTGPDTTPPSVVSTSPAAGAGSVSTGVAPTATFSEAVQAATVSFTVLDAASAPVAGSVAYDGPSKTATFTPTAPLTPSTTYTATVAGAQDLAGNPMSTPTIWPFTTAAVVGPTCPCTIFSSGVIPGNAAAGDSGAVEVGVKFRSDVAGVATGVRFFKGAGNTGTHLGRLWSSTGSLLASATFSGESASGWQQVDFASPVAIVAGTTYVASYFAPNGHYAVDNNFFGTSGYDTPPLHALRSGVDGPNGVYRYGAGGGFPTDSYQATNYWVDVVMNGSTGPDTTPPSVVSTSPAAGAGSVSTGVAPTATFSEAVQAATVSFTVLDAASAPVAGSVAYDGPSKTATFTPTAPLTPSTTYTATVSGALDAAGNPMSSPTIWSFTTAAVVGPTCPCSVWSVGAAPVNAAAGDSGAVEVGVKFRSDVAGVATGVRFFKGAGNSGTHVGNLWSSTGSLLASATFSGESASGWQQVDFASPVAIAAGTTYVASYFAPNGHYASDNGAFATAGVDNAPLHALRSGVDGGNGVYHYGAGGGFPTDSYQATNYWVDVVMNGSTGPDTTPPSVVSTSPAAGAGSVSTGVAPTATFSEAVQAATVSFTVLDAASAPVAGSVAYDGPSKTATFTPTAPLTPSTTYTATVAGAQDLAGNPMSTPTIWPFTTAAAPSQCPCALFAGGVTPGNAAAGDSGAVEVGVKFRSDVAGVATGVRFFKGAGNSGTHVGNLWSSTGSLLASATFSGESASGWQQVDFASPVAIAAGTTYVASYFAPNGHYAVDNDFFTTSGYDTPPLHALRSGVDGPNGVYRYGSSSGFPIDSYRESNYWVDVVIG